MDLWFEDELSPTVESVDEITKTLQSGLHMTLADVSAEARALVRAHTPHWQMIESAQLLKSGEPCAFYQVRLSFDFDIPKSARDRHVQFVSAICSAWLWSETRSGAQPRAYDIYPRDLYEGEPREVSVEVGPELKLGDASASLGKLNTDVRIGHVEPVVVGFLGKEEREPRWELRTGGRPLIGVRHLWLLIEAPRESGGVRLAVRVEGDLQTRFGRIPVGPKQRAADARPSVLIR